MFKPLSCLVIASFLITTSCSHDNNKKEDTRPAEEIYADAINDLNKEKFRKAIEKFEDVERNYPYSKSATSAQLMAAYARYEDEQYDEAVIALERFIKLHPGHESTPYAYYLKALCYYERISTINRDQSFTAEAEGALKEVVARFPNTTYARDANIKLDLVLDHLAGKELEVGRFYLKQQQYIAAINRFQQVVEKYQTTSQIPEALHRLVEANLALGLTTEAQKYAAVLGHNYPESKWYTYSYNLLEGKDLPTAALSKEEAKKIGEPGSKKSWFRLPFFNKKKRDVAPPPTIDNNTLAPKQ
jgi:outer membrane protein assembly factor BamD